MAGKTPAEISRGIRITETCTRNASGTTPPRVVFRARKRLNNGTKIAINGKSVPGFVVRAVLTQWLAAAKRTRDSRVGFKRWPFVLTVACRAWLRADDSNARNNNHTVAVTFRYTVTAARGYGHFYRVHFVRRGVPRAFTVRIFGAR